MAVIQPIITPPAAGGNFAQGVKVGFGQGPGYIFQSGFLMPEVSSAMTRQFPQYALRTMLEKLGRFDEIDAVQYNWGEMGRARAGGQFTAAGGAGSAAASNALTTNILSATPYWQAGLTLLTDYGKSLRVDSVDNTGTYQVLTCYLMDNVNDTWAGAIGTAAATSISIGFGHLANVLSGEGANFVQIPQITLPLPYTNQMNFIHRVMSYSDDAMSNRIYLKDKEGKDTGYFYLIQDMTTMSEFGADEERALIFHTWNGTPNSTIGRAGDGIFTSLMKGNAGTNNTYSTTLFESDIRNQINAMILVANITGSTSTEFSVFAGNDYASEFTVALEKYCLNGGILYGSMSKYTEAGVPFTQYKFRNVILNLFDYMLLNDQQTAPFVGAPGSGKINFRKFAFWLNMGSDSSGNKLITGKTLRGKRMWKTEFPGNVNADGTPASVGSIMAAKAQYVLQGNLGVQLRYAATHGCHYAA